MRVKCDIPLSNFAFTCNLRRYKLGRKDAREVAAAEAEAGWVGAAAAEAAAAAATLVGVCGTD